MTQRQGQAGPITASRLLALVRVVGRGAAEPDHEVDHLMGRDRRRHEDVVIAVLAGHSAFRSVARLHDELRARGHGMGLVTVYRRLRDLARRGDLDVIPGHRGEARYRLCCVHTEHQPLVCTLCQRVVDVDSAAVTSWARATAARHGFTDVRVRAMVTGTCPVCPR